MEEADKKMAFDKNVDVYENIYFSAI